MTTSVRHVPAKHTGGLGIRDRDRQAFHGRRTQCIPILRLSRELDMTVSQYVSAANVKILADSSVIRMEVSGLSSGQKTISCNLMCKDGNQISRT